MIADWAAMDQRHTFTAAGSATKNAGLFGNAPTWATISQPAQAYTSKAERSVSERLIGNGFNALEYLSLNGHPLPGHKPVINLGRKLAIVLLALINVR